MHLVICRGCRSFLASEFPYLHKKVSVFSFFPFTLGRATGDGGAKLRRASLPTGRQPAGPFFGLGGSRLATLSAPAARLRLPADGQQVTSMPTHRS